MTPRSADDAWKVSEHTARIDPLLDCLVQLTRIHGNPSSAEALSSGLPKVDHLLPPSQFSRAAARANLSARLLRKSINELPDKALPAVILQHGKQACLLLERIDASTVRISTPENPESPQIMSVEELELTHAGYVIVVQPKFRFDARGSAGSPASWQTLVLERDFRQLALVSGRTGRRTAGKYLRLGHPPVLDECVRPGGAQPRA